VNHLCDCGGNLIGLSQIEPKDVSPRGVATLRGRLLELILAPSDEHHARTLPDEFHRNRVADTR